MNTTRFKGLDALGADPRVEKIYQDSDGIWVELHYGYRNANDEPNGALHGFHEDRVSVIRSKTSGAGIAPCDCADCLDGIARRAAKGGAK